MQHDQASRTWDGFQHEQSKRGCYLGAFRVQRPRPFLKQWCFRRARWQKGTYVSYDTSTTRARMNDTISQQRLKVATALLQYSYVRRAAANRCGHDNKHGARTYELYFSMPTCDVRRRCRACRRREKRVLNVCGRKNFLFFCICSTLSWYDKLGIKYHSIKVLFFGHQTNYI